MLAILSSFYAWETLLLRIICDLAGLHSNNLFLIIVTVRIESFLNLNVPEGVVPLVSIKVFEVHKGNIALIICHFLKIKVACYLLLNLCHKIFNSYFQGL